MHDSVPKLIQADQDLFIQVMINLLQQTVVTVGGRGFIKINSYKKLLNQIQTLVIDFDASKFLPDKQMAVKIINLAQERDIKKILSANVNLNFKIAKILCNQLGWRIEFNSFTASRYSLFIPLLHSAVDDEANLEEVKEEMHHRSANLYNKPRVVSSKQSQREKYFYKDNYEQLDQFDEGTRPQSAQMPQLHSTGMRFKMFNQIKEDPQKENEPGSPAGNSTRTLGIDSEAKAKLYG